MKNEYILLIVMLIFFSFFAIFMFVGDGFNTAVSQGDVRSRCGDGICGINEDYVTCPGDCECRDTSYDEFMGEWSRCNNKQQRRLLQNSCGDTKIETQTCISSGNEEGTQQTVVKLLDIVNRLRELNKKINAAISAYNDGLITGEVFRDRINDASEESLVIYYDITNTDLPVGYSGTENALNKAIAAELSGINEVLKYFEDYDISHLDSGTDWIDIANLYADDAATTLESAA
jgi:hypothetical protein